MARQRHIRIEHDSLFCVFAFCVFVLGLIEEIDVWDLKDLSVVEVLVEADFGFGVIWGFDKVFFEFFEDYLVDGVGHEAVSGGFFGVLSAVEFLLSVNFWIDEW